MAASAVPSTPAAPPSASASASASTSALASASGPASTFAAAPQPTKSSAADPLLAIDASHRTDPPLASALLNGLSNTSQAKQLPADLSAAAQGWEAGLEHEAQTLLEAGQLDVWDVLTRRFESKLIQTALHNTKGRRIEAAQKLGIGRNTITRKIQELNLE